MRRSSAERPWTTATARRRTTEILDRWDPSVPVVDVIDAFADESRGIHDRAGLNLNPATNTMNPRAERLLAAGLGTRPSLGHPGEKYEMGLEAIESIEVLASELACEVFRARHAELRLASGAMANLAAFMTFTRPGDTIIVPPATIGGHVTHNAAGAAGLYGLKIVEAPIDPERYTIDVAALSGLIERVRPALLTVGSSLNLTHHPVAEMVALGRSAGIPVMFDAAHLSGPIAGGAWPDPLAAGVDVVTMSTYKSLAGPPAGLLLTNDDDVAARVDEIVFPGLTANFDVSKTAALAVTLDDWRHCGREHAEAMVRAAADLAGRLQERGVPVVDTPEGPTNSHAFALDAGAHHGDGDAAARHLRRANLLTCAIGLPGDGDGVMRGLRLGTNELVRWGIDAEHLEVVADVVARAWSGAPDDLVVLVDEVAAFRRSFATVHFCRA